MGRADGGHCPASADLATHELTESVEEALQRPRRLGGFGLSSAVLLSPFA